MKRRTVVIGQKFDDLEVIDEAPRQCGKTRVFLRCKCGKVVERFLSSMHKVGAFRRSCGCARKMYGSKKRSQHKSHDGVFLQLAQDFYLGVI